jgi:hypothetical protein
MSQTQIAPGVKAQMKKTFRKGASKKAHPGEMALSHAKYKGKTKC